MLRGAPTNQLVPERTPCQNSNAAREHIRPFFGGNVPRSPGMISSCLHPRNTFDKKRRRRGQPPAPFFRVWFLSSSTQGAALRRRMFFLPFARNENKRTLIPRPQSSFPRRKILHGSSIYLENLVSRLQSETFSRRTIFDLR
jgi:hypothetical protein